MKTCTKCKIEKETSEFYFDKRKKDGLRSWCKLCQQNDNKKRETNYNETRRVYRSTHKEEYRTLKKEYYNVNKDVILKNNSKWRQTLNGRMSSYIIGARFRNIEWNLTKEEFELFWGKKCHYCGDVINGVGIDRIDSSVGYRIENIIPCCTGCNIGKMDYSYDEYIERTIKIYNNLKLWDHIKK